MEIRGIRLYRFALEPEQFVSGDLDGNNKGFCVTGEEKRCLVTGLIDVSVCVPSRTYIKKYIGIYLCGTFSIIMLIMLKKL